MEQFRSGTENFAEPRKNYNFRVKRFKIIFPIMYLCSELLQNSLERVQFGWT